MSKDRITEKTGWKFAEENNRSRFWDIWHLCADIQQNDNLQVQYKFLSLDLNPRTHKYEVNTRLKPHGCDIYKGINPLPISKNLLMHRLGTVTYNLPSIFNTFWATQTVCTIPLCDTAARNAQRIHWLKTDSSSCHFMGLIYSNLQLWDLENEVPLPHTSTFLFWKFSLSLSLSIYIYIYIQNDVSYAHTLQIKVFWYLPFENESLCYILWDPVGNNVCLLFWVLFYCYFSHLF